jgi:autotransporter-associated beta strand protein
VKRSGTVTIEQDSKTFSGSYTVEKGWLEVNTASGGHKAMQLGNMPPHALAKQLLWVAPG